MIEFIDEFIEYMIAKYKRTSFGIETIKFELMTKFNKRSLMYASIGGKWLKQFFHIMQQLGYGTYNEATMFFTLNQDNNKVILWVEKYGKDSDGTPT